VGIVRGKGSAEGVLSPRSVDRQSGGRAVGISNDTFIKYPRTPHLFGSRGTDDDKHLSQNESAQLIADPSLIVEEKLDGTNVGIHFTTAGHMVLQCRGHEITEGMHPQYDLFKQWTMGERPVLEVMLAGRFLLFGEWLYARHSLHYRRLPHYFFEFDIYDKRDGAFLDLKTRLDLIDGTGILTVPVVHRDVVDQDRLGSLIGPSLFESVFSGPVTRRDDGLMEGLYLRTEAAGRVTRRAKLVRPAFVEKVKLSVHWQHQAMVPNLLADGVEIWS
jgi:hypothetical protein